MDHLLTAAEVALFILLWLGAGPVVAYALFGRCDA
jgi:hypothetical protein